MDYSDKKITHIITGLNLGGAERALQKLILNQCLPHKNILVISLTTTGSIGIQLQEKGFRVITLDMKSFFSVPNTIKKLIEILKKESPDIVQTWLYHADLLGGIAARLAGITNIIWGIRTTELRRGSYSTAIIRRICALLSNVIPKKIVSVAYSAQRRHIDLGYNSKNMIVIGNGFDTSIKASNDRSRKEIRSIHQIDENTILIGSVGRFNQVKGQDLFIKSIKFLAPEYPNLKYILIGRNNNNENQELMKWIKESGYPEKIILVEETEHIEKYYSAMDIFCLHSRSEGFPNVLGEAMLSALPCISTNVGDAALLLDNNKFITKGISSEELADTINKMLSLSCYERAVIGAKSRERIIKYFAMSSISDKYLCLYNEILSC